MRVAEYLRYRANLKGVTGMQVRKRVADVLELCSLHQVERKLIGALSKGYRQRVGLADALVADPDLLILDEPTIGLDPNQLRSVRQLIKDLGRKHTILLSTHILPEVEATCSHVLILHQGRILASDATENLQRNIFQSGPAMAELTASTSTLQEFFAAQSEVETVDIVATDGDWKRVTLTGRDGHDLRPLIHQWACTQRWPLRELTHGRHTLEDVFVKITRTEKEE
jgi:ABC-2 type transport system ATP-binding protein